MTIPQWLKQAEAQLTEAGVSSARLDSQLLAGFVLKLERAQLLAQTGELSADEEKQLEELLNLRLTRKPLAYIHGQREFYGLDFVVNEEVLVPRPETEVMVEYLIKNCRQKSQLLELGTGSGAIALATAKHRVDLKITATDVSTSALQVTRENAKLHKLSPQLLESDLFEKITNTYDVIAANLPYVPTAARRQPEITFEPDVALYGDDDGLVHYRRFFSDLSSHLAGNGWFIIEASPTQFRELQKLAKANDFSLEAISEYIFWGQRLSGDTKSQ